MLFDSQKFSFNITNLLSNAYLLVTIGELTSNVCSLHISDLKQKARENRHKRSRAIKSARKKSVKDSPLGSPRGGTSPARKGLGSGGDSSSDLSGQVSASASADGFSMTGESSSTDYSRM